MSEAGVTRVIGAVVPMAAPAMAAAAVLTGWGTFVAVVEDEDEDAMPLRASAGPDGPAIVHNPELLPAAVMNRPENVMIWLPVVLGHLSQAVLEDSRRDLPELCSPRWDSFRQHCSVATAMSWDAIREAVRREGVEFMADHLSASLYLEGGIQEALAKRALGRPHLRVV